jgi:ribulose-5-phosphate 4-epimerase/fuculose-1-phosphate aldolase
MAETDKLALRREMVDICRRMNSSGINQGTAGNLSVRTDDGFLITPSSMPYDTMQPDDLVEMGFDGTYVGHRPSSSTATFCARAPISTWSCIAIRSTRRRSPAITRPFRAFTT